MKMTSISIEEENYVRMALLLTGICPRAVRVLFDKTFPPASLGLTVNDKKVEQKLYDLSRKRVINKAQWDLLFPISGIPDSQDFDVTLMITLLRNLTKMTPPKNGYEKFPLANEITPASDLARIKNYRNDFAHRNIVKIDCLFFKTVWTDTSDAVERLGGITMKHECDHLMIKPLDMSSQEISRDLQQANKDIQGIKQSLEVFQADNAGFKTEIQTLKSDHDSLKTEFKKYSQELTIIYKRVEEKQTKFEHTIKQLKSDSDCLQEKLGESNEEVSKLKTNHETLQNSFNVHSLDTVPWNRRVYIKSELEEWQKETENFIKTSAVKHTLQCIQENSCVTITASSGVGKTTTLRQVALEMENEGYDIIPLTYPMEIVQLSNPNKKTLFVIDNFCGTYSLNHQDIVSLDQVMDQIKKRIENNLTKIIVACRLQVYKDDKFQSLSVFKKCVCNLSENLCLSKTEKRSIAKLYLKEKAAMISEYYDSHDCFPLLCKLYSVNPELDIKDYFRNPFEVYADEIDILHANHHGKYCALALCVMFNNRLDEKWLTDEHGEIDKAKRKIIANTCETCKLNRGTSRLILLDEIKSLERTFIRKERNVYKTLHDKIFDFLTYYFGQTMIRCLITNADIHVIQQRFVLNKQEDKNQFIIVLAPEYHDLYIQRMIDDWYKGRVRCVFMNTNMKIPKFRYQFLMYLKNLNISYQGKLALICDVLHRDTALCQCCVLGDISLIKWSIEHHADVNQCDDHGVSALVISVAKGFTEIVEILLDNNAEINLSTSNDESPLYIACAESHIEIVKLLLDNKANINKCTNYGMSPLFIACRLNKEEIVKLLLDYNADSNQCTDNGVSPLLVACQDNYIKIVEMLLDNKADTIQCTDNGVSPLFIACQNNHFEIVKMLLVNNADANKCTDDGVSPLLVACQNNYFEIVKILQDYKADTNKCTDNGVSPLLFACYNNHFEIVKMLLVNNADVNTCTKNESSPLLVACEKNLIKIVNLLLDNNADINKCGGDGAFPLFLACQENHIELVKILLDNKADIDQCSKNGATPLLVACKNNHIQTVKLLIDNKADINKCQNDISPLYIACCLNNKEIVNVLLDNNADINKCKIDGASPLFLACQENYIELVKILLDNKADINNCLQSGASPLLIACQMNHKETVKLLIDNKADINKCNDVEVSPLFIACQLNNKEVVKILLDNKADMNKCSDNVPTPLHIACKRNHISITKLLLENKAEPNKCDFFGATPLMNACSNNNMQIIELLLDNNADVNVCTYFGTSPLGTAVAFNNIDLIRMLLRKGAKYDKMTSVLHDMLQTFGIKCNPYMEEPLD